MKKTVIILSLLFVSSYSFAQSSCTWNTDWQTIYSPTQGGEEKVEVSFALANCENGNLRGQPGSVSYWRTRNSFNKPKGTVSFKIEYRDCAGKLQHESPHL